MTEVKDMNDPAYLRGRVDALESILERLVYAMPTLVLDLISAELPEEEEATISARNASPEQIDGFTSVTTACLHAIEMEKADRAARRGWEGGPEDDVALIAASTAAISAARSERTKQ